MAALPSGVGTDVSLNYEDLPTNTWIIDWTSKQVRGMDAGMAAMRQAVEITLSTERFWQQIYNSNFGVELDGLPGKEEAYIESELPRRIRDAFSVDNRILSVENFAFSRSGTALAASFDVITVYGTVPGEVTV